MNWGFQNAKCLSLPPLDQQHMLTSLAASKKLCWCWSLKLGEMYYQTSKSKKNIAWAWIKSRLNSWTCKGLWLAATRYGCLLTFISAKSRFMRLLGRNCLSKATSSRGATFKASLQTVIRSKGRRVIRFLDIWDIVCIASVHFTAWLESTIYSLIRLPVLENVER